MLFLALSLVGSCRRAPDEPHASATLKGRVVSAQGRSLAAVKLTLNRSEAELAARGAHPGVASAEAISDEHGAFRFPNQTAGRFQLRAQAPGFATLTVPVLLVDGETVTSALRLDPFQLIEGTVLDAQGKPVPQALIFAWPAGGPRSGVVEARSSTDGRFALAGVSAGIWSILAEAPGFSTLQLSRVEVPARDLILRLEGESRTMGGVVMMDDSHPARGARVILGGPDIAGPRETITNDKGIFLFHGLGFGRYAVRASQDSRVSTSQRVIIDEGTGFIPPIRLKLGPGLRVSGRILDDQGRGLPGAKVELSSVPPDDAPELSLSSVSGAFTLGPVPVGAYQLAARAAGHAPGVVPDLRVATGATRTWELRLPRSARIFGRVVDEASHPVKGATVTARPPAAVIEQLGVIVGSLPPAAEAANQNADSPRIPESTRTHLVDADGRFLIADLLPARVHLYVASPQNMAIEREIGALKPGETRDLGTLVLATGGTVTGRLVDMEGDALPGARVEVVSGGHVFRASPDAKGAFVLRAPVGEWEVYGLSRGYAPCTRSHVVVQRDRPTPALLLRLGPASASVQGDVLGPDGRPVAQAVVLAYQPSAVAPDVPGAMIDSTTTNKLGHFKLTGLPTTAVILEARHPHGAATRQVVTPPASQTLLRISQRVDADPPATAGPRKEEPPRR